jgi:hypothetical protein
LILIDELSFAPLDDTGCSVAGFQPGEAESAPTVTVVRV